jgi:hypothetical protein
VSTYDYTNFYSSCKGFFYLDFMNMVTKGRSMYDHINIVMDAVTSLKVADSILKDTGFFNCPNRSSSTMALGFTQPQQKWVPDVEKNNVAEE